MHLRFLGLGDGSHPVYIRPSNHVENLSSAPFVWLEGTILRLRDTMSRFNASPLMLARWTTAQTAREDIYASFYTLPQKKKKKSSGAWITCKRSPLKQSYVSRGHTFSGSGLLHTCPASGQHQRGDQYLIRPNSGANIATVFDIGASLLLPRPCAFRLARKCGFATAIQKIVAHVTNKDIGSTRYDGWCLIWWLYEQDWCKAE